MSFPDITGEKLWTYFHNATRLTIVGLLSVVVHYLSGLEVRFVASETQGRDNAAAIKVLSEKVDNLKERVTEHVNTDKEFYSFNKK